MVSEYISIGLIIVCCIASSITDIKYALIRNRLLICLCIPAILSNLVSIVRLENIDFRSYLLSLLLALFFSSILYILKIWAGGDYKLCVLLLLSMPYRIMVLTINGIYASIIMIALSFAIGYVYIIIDSLIMWKKEKITHSGILTKTGKQFLKYIPLYLAVVMIQAFLRFVAGFFSFSINEWLTAAITIIFIIAIQKIKILENIAVVIILAIADCILSFTGVIDLFTVRLVTLWGAIVITYFLRNFMEQFNYETIKTDDLKPGMILSLSSSVMIKNLKKSKYKTVSDESLRSRLTDADINSINESLKGKDEIEELVIVRKIPFSLFISISVTIFITGAFFNVY